MVNREGIEIFYAEAGRGPAILWHTGGGGDGRMWQMAGYGEGLAGYRHLYLDHRGRGRSGRPRSVAAHRLDEYVADVLAVLDDAGVDRAAMVGYSGGAYVAYAVAAARPDRISAVVGIGTVGPPPEDQDHPDREAEELRTFTAEIRRGGVGAFIENMGAAEGQAPPSWLVENLALTDAEMFVLSLEAWASEPSGWDLLARVQAPTLIVCGEREEEGAAAYARAAAAGAPRAEAMVFDDLGHLQTFWRTDLTLGPIRSFLERNFPSAGA